MPRLSGAEPMFRRVANDLKTRIETGEFQPGRQLPREENLAAEYEVSRVTMRRATRLLEFDRILEVRHGHGTFVRQHVEPETVTLAPGQKVLGRMPTLDEQQELGIADTTPILIVLDTDGSAQIYATDRVILVCP